MPHTENKEHEQRDGAKSPARVLDSTAGQSALGLGGQKLNVLNTKTRPHTIYSIKIAVMSSGAPLIRPNERAAEAALCEPSQHGAFMRDRLTMC
jgi:hypothetical protein